MKFFEASPSRYFLLALFVFVSFVLFWQLDRYPLIDYDEATYAKVVIDTLDSGDLLTLKRFNEPWFEKPPLYFWMSMVSVKIFGEKDIAFRIPSVIMSIVLLWLVFLIVKLLTKNDVIAILAVLILLFSPSFFIYAREARLDSGVIMAMLMAFYSIIRGWSDKRYLAIVAPAIAVGFLFKSVTVFLILPVIIIFSFVYKEWSWLKSRYLWWGVAASILIAVPWHIIEYMRHGEVFWTQYIEQHVLVRATTGVSQGATYDPFFYLSIMWLFYQPWAALLLFLLLVVFVVWKYTKVNIDKTFFASLISAIGILLIISSMATHLITYKLPSYPFLAITIAVMMYYVYLSSGKKLRIFLLILLMPLFLAGFLIGYGIIDTYTREVVRPYHYEQKEAALVYKEKHHGEPFYIFDWPFNEALRYYSGVKTMPRYKPTNEDLYIKAPFYLLMPALDLAAYFFDKNGNPLPEFEDINVYFYGKDLFLLYFDEDLILKPKN